MSNPTVISAENLGKSYRISHQIDRERYIALRDVITDTVKGLFHPKKPAEGPAGTEEFWALKNVSFEVKRGEVVGILGRNGAGKSTLLKILSRITEPSEGRVRIKGRVASLLEVGTGFHPELTGRENIFLNGAILGMTRMEIRRKFDEIVAFSDIEKFLDTTVKRYSSGMYMRLAFAVAAHLEPEILIVDEVLAVGDAEFQQKCLGKMQEVSTKDSRTVLFVSHNMNMLRQICPRGLIINRGEVQFQGSGAECVDTYLSAAGSAEGLIIERADHRCDFLRVQDIRVNGSAGVIVSLPGRVKEIRIEVVFVTQKPVSLNLEMHLLDPTGSQVGTFNPGFFTGVNHSFAPGRHKLTAVIDWPGLTRGRYVISLSLVNPGIQVYVDLPHAVQMEVEGVSGKTSLTLDFSPGLTGPLILEGESSHGS